MMKAQDMLVERINNLCKEKGLSYYNLSYCSAVPLTTLMQIIAKIYVCSNQKDANGRTFTLSAMQRIRKIMKVGKFVKKYYKQKSQ